MRTIQDRFESAYIPKVKAFTEKVIGLKATGMPEPHLPHWGVEYETAPFKVGIIGQDTRGWGEMGDFIKMMNSDPRAALYRGKEDFDSFEFTTWTNNFGTSFWDTSMKLLAGVYGVRDWKQLKNREVTEPLKNFFWANAHSVELFKSSAEEAGVSKKVWQAYKTESEEHLDSDSLQTILDVFEPHVIFVLYWGADALLSGRSLKYPDRENKYFAETIDPKTGALILLAPHPRSGKLSDAIIKKLIRRAKRPL